ncbi:UvrD-helicase domain-containing protein [Candidatus Falkowbacteria bacterium]|nr:UvrD-helicase domain-containing protein [Candidatus Falkowbacteria bacterium]
MEVGEITKNLNPEQQAAVTHASGPLLIVAGAGTGKTTVLTQRLAWLIIEQKLKPEEILAVTFTEKAAEEMAERVSNLLPYGYVETWISTFHAFCERILQAHALDIGLPTNFKVLNETAQWLLVRENLDKFNLDYYRPLGNPAQFIHALIKHFSRAKDEMISAAAYLAHAEKLRVDLDGMESSGGKARKQRSKEAKKQESNEAKKQISQETNKQNSQGGEVSDDVLEVSRLNEVADAYHTYQQLLLENNALDFGDLINYTLKLFQERPQILNMYQEQFKHILVDEFQDTNWAQYQLVKLLAQPRNNITVVGDDDQAIYRFRGASLSNILEFKSDYPQAHEVVLTENYRSAQPILDLAYTFIQHNNPNRLECKLNESKEISAQAKQKGVDLKKFKVINKKLRAASTLPCETAHLRFETANQEVAGVLNKIIELKKQDQSALWSDFAILVRSNAAARPFNLALQRSGVPFQFMALRGLYTKEVILDVLAYFNLLDDYHESAAVWRVLNFPVFKLPGADLIQISHQAKYKGWSLYESLQHVGEYSARLSRESFDEINHILSFIAKHTALAAEKSAGEVMVTALADLGYTEYLKNADTQWAAEDLGYLRQLYQKIRDFEQASDEPKLKNFMRLMRLEIEAGEEGALEVDLEAGPDVVRVMTVHGSKGLEFKYVFIVNLVQLRFPTTERGDPIELPEALIKEVLPEGDAHLQEERRLLYVAMTRAKQGLYFTSAKDYGGQRQKKPSVFLTELGYGERPLDASTAFSEEHVLDIKYVPRPAQPVTALPLPKVFTYSQLSTFERCPVQYKYLYILKIVPPGSSYLSFGNTIHLTLQKFMQLFLDGRSGGQADLFGADTVLAGTKLSPLETLLRLYDESWIDAWYRDRREQQEYRDKGRRVLRQYYTYLQAHPPRPLKLESGFKIRLGQYWLAGKIDRIDELDGGVEIIDYKTGKPKIKLESADKDQLLIYQLAAEQAFGLSPRRLTYQYLDNDAPVSFLGDEKDKQKITAKIIALIEEIKTSDFTHDSAGQCKFCQFKDMADIRSV